MSNNNDLLVLLEKYIVLFQNLTATQQKKLEAAQQYCMEALDECMKSEQADTLLLRGYDKKRLSLQDELNFHDMTFNQIIPLLPQEDQYEFSKAFRSLNDAYLLYKDTADCAKQVIEINIHHLSNAVEKLQQKTNTASGKVYSESGTIDTQDFSFKDIKI